MMIISHNPSFGFFVTDFHDRSCDMQNIFFRLFIDSQKLSDEVHTHLMNEKMSVTVLPYADVATHLANLVSQAADGKGKIWVSVCYSVLLECFKVNLYDCFCYGEWLDLI